METQDEVEVKVHAISLRRPRSRKRASTASSTSAKRGAGMFRSVGSVLSRALEPPHQGLLALLGLSSLAVKSAGSAWKTLVKEGAIIEGAVSRRLTTAVQSLPLSAAGRETESSPSRFII